MAFPGLLARTSSPMVMRLPRTLGKSGSSCGVGRHLRAELCSCRRAQRG